MWRQGFPDHAACDESLTGHYEAAQGQGIDRHEQYVRRKLAVPGRADGWTPAYAGQLGIRLQRLCRDPI